MLRDLNLAVPASDMRRIDVLASGLPGRSGVQVAIDATLRCAVRADGTAHPRADWEDGAVLQQARLDKMDRYPEFVDGVRCQLLVMGVEAGGRIGEDTLEFISGLAYSRAQCAPSYLRRAAAL
eukprot:4082578-Karenia_brevis.AAC.1